MKLLTDERAKRRNKGVGGAGENSSARYYGILGAFGK